MPLSNSLRVIYKYLIFCFTKKCSQTYTITDYEIENNPEARSSLDLAQIEL